MPQTVLSFDSVVPALCHLCLKTIVVKLLALALTNLVLSLVNLVTNMAKPSLGQPSY